MAELAKNYHEDLQNQGIHITDPEERKQKIADALQNVTKAELIPEIQDLTNRITEQCIWQALSKSQAGKATGLDGLPYEFWNTLRIRYNNAADEDSAFDVTEMLALLYNDVNRFGIEEESGFANGWICPLYKKKDRRSIANYRPITLLNSDYKIYTRILTSRLAPVASAMIHSDQAGFLPGRRITDQTQLCRTMIDYAEATEENGVIIALDQEKAYDKVQHEYLWDTLEAIGLPTKFIEWIKNLYKHATTVVTINGETSTAFKVIRGVRQGDPLSCLLFDLAIEPLACMIRASSLKGFRIPGLAEKLVASLFADDTSTFLSYTDKWSELWTILDDWCSLSGARFNRDKTEVVPVGAPEYRQAVIATRRIDPTMTAEQPIPDYVHIAEDGKPVRMLGAWIGNKTDQADIWAPTIHKVKAFLERWQRCHPSMKGKRHIVQMGPGGITQYLATVQGMPQDVENTLTKTIRHFVWGTDKPPPINLETICKKVEDGGLGILDIKARNEAIDLMWLKRYLDLSKDRPRWAFLVDAILAVRVTKDAGAIQRSAQINTFLQDWRPATHSQSKLPPYLKKLLNTAKKHNTSFAAIKLDKDVKAQLPAWYHISANKHMKKLNNTSLSKCLRNTHGVKLVIDLLKTSQHPPIQNNGSENECACNECQRLNQLGCKHPLRCREAAGRIISNLSNKWDPRSEPTPDGLTLTTKRLDLNTTALEEGGKVIFNPTLTMRGGITEAFRTFVDDETLNNPPAIRQKPGRVVTHEAQTVIIIKAPNSPNTTRSDGPQQETKNEDVGYAWFSAGNSRNSLTHIDPTGKVEDKTWAELTAALHVVRTTPLDVPLNIVSETKCLTNELVKDLTRTEDKGWLDTPNQVLLRAILNTLRQRCAPTTFRQMNQREDKERTGKARKEALRDRRERREPAQPDTSLNATFNLSGVRLSTLTQKIAYLSIRNRRQIGDRRATLRNMNKATEHIAGRTEKRVQAKDIWNSLRHKDIRRQISDFLWKTMHDAHKCGAFWDAIPGLEERGTCTRCGTTDSMEHILTKCSAPGQTLVWKLVGNLWKKKKLRWTKPTIDDILTVGLRQWKNTTGKKTRRPCAERLWRILISESAFLVWKLRCERVIGHSEEEDWCHTEAAIKTRWVRMVNERLHLDMAMTHRRFGRKSLDRNQVLGTWINTLHDELALPDDWTTLNWVLVGIEPAPD